MTITIGKTTKPCPVCHGAGVIGEPGLTFPGRTCAACDGGGVIARAEHTAAEPSA